MRGRPPKPGSLLTCYSEVQVHPRIKGGGFNHGASACGGARATEHSAMLAGRDQVSVATSANKSLKFVPGLTAVHRTPLSGRRLASRYASRRKL